MRCLPNSNAWAVKTKRYLVIVFIISCFYVLSEGPAYRLMRLKSIPYRLYSFCYSPVIWACHKSNVIDSIFTRYENIWYSDGDEIVDYINANQSRYGDLNKTNRLDSTRKP